MSARLALRATVDAGEQYSVQRLAYPVRALEVVMAIPLSESATRHLK